MPPRAPVSAKAASASVTARSPMACTATSRSCSAARRSSVAQLLGRLVGLALGEAEDGLLGVGVAAPRGAGVERAVADDLERAHRQPAVAVERVAGAQPARDDVLEAVGVAGVPHPEQVRAAGPALGPVGHPAAELEVDHARPRRARRRASMVRR